MWKWQIMYENLYQNELIRLNSRLTACLWWTVAGWLPWTHKWLPLLGKVTEDVWKHKSRKQLNSKQQQWTVNSVFTSLSWSSIFCQRFLFPDIALMNLRRWRSCAAFGLSNTSPSSSETNGEADDSISLSLVESIDELIYCLCSNGKVLASRSSFCS